MEKNNKEKSMVCDCENCQVPYYRSYHKHFFLRWFLGLLILAIVFVVGFKLGEFKEMLNNLGFGPHGYSRDYMIQRGFPMMNGSVQTQAPTTSTNSSKTTTK